MTFVGVNLLNLVTYITAWPDATLDEMAAFIYYNKGGDLYSRQAISNSLKNLDITRKKGVDRSISDAAAGRRFCVWGFWDCPPPLGS